MKENKNLQEKLKNLPKYSLNNEQKNNIMLSLKSKRKTQKKIQLLVPFISIAVICAIVFLLFISENNGEGTWLNELKRAFQPKIELTAQEGIVFEAPPYEVIGVEGKIGLLVFNEQFVAEDPRRGSKLMLYFWGDMPGLVGKNYRVEAKNTYGNELQLSEGVLDSPIYTDDAHILTSFPAFPTEGKWQLSIFVEDQLFEEFTLNVLPPFPKTKNYTFGDSPKEIIIGKETEVFIESTVDSGKEIKVRLKNNKGSIISEQAFKQDGMFTTTAGVPIYHYNGSIKFPEKGTWTLEINGQKTRPFTN